MQSYENTKSGRRDSDLSEYYLYQECEKIDDHPEEGTYPRCAMQVLKEKGIPTDEAWPYEENLTPTTQPEPWADTDASERKISSYYRVTTLKQLLKAIATVGPALLTIKTDLAWIFLESPYIIDVNKSNAIGNHAVVVCGYDQTKKTIDIVNSWGSSWGSYGHARITFDYFTKHKVDCWIPVVGE